MPHLLLHYVIWLLAVYAIAALTLAFLAAESVDGYQDEKGFHANSTQGGCGETAFTTLARVGKRHVSQRDVVEVAGGADDRTPANIPAE